MAESEFLSDLEDLKIKTIQARVILIFLMMVLNTIRVTVTLTVTLIVVVVTKQSTMSIHVLTTLPLPACKIL